MERPTSSDRSGGSSSSSHSCCAGLAYYTLAMQQRGAKPFCFGLSYNKEGTMTADDSQLMPPGTEEYQFLCMGFTANSQPHDGHQGSTVLPYCEGIEMITYVQGQPMARTALPQGPRSPAEAAAALASVSSRKDSALAAAGNAAAEVAGGHADAAAASAAAMAAAAAAAAAVGGGGPMTVCMSESTSGSAGAKAQGRKGLGDDTVGDACGKAERADYDQQRQRAQQQDQQGQGHGSGKANAEDASPSTSGRQPFSDRFRGRLWRNMEAMQGMLRNEGPLRMRGFDSGQQLYDRACEVGANNAAKMQRAAAFASALVAERCGWAWQAVASRLDGSGGSGRQSGPRDGRP